MPRDPATYTYYVDTYTYGDRVKTKLTLSAGVAGLRPQELPLNLLDASEAACTRAKQAGRDSVVMR